MAVKYVKLTDSIKAAYVRAIMQDVPFEDFDTPAIIMARTAIDKLMPARIKDIVDLGDGCDAAKWIKRTAVDLPWPLETDHYYTSDYGRNIVKERLPEVWNDLVVVAARKESLQKQHAEMRARIRAAADSVKTTKQLEDLLPEFAKYLPQSEVDACRTLPAITNLVEDLTKFGWKKGETA